mmetsp:Transcript_15105/g.32552  ORF Transcript_15105/g.32552 Transcript_15105/m.32552 type:complete len:222 (+) Transcript_15105:34-699(+)
MATKMLDCCLSTLSCPVEKHGWGTLESISHFQPPDRPATSRLGHAASPSATSFLGEMFTVRKVDAQIKAMTVPQKTFVTERYIPDWSLVREDDEGQPPNEEAEAVAIWSRHATEASARASQAMAYAQQQAETAKSLATQAWRNWKKLYAGPQISPCLARGRLQKFREIQQFGIPMGDFFLVLPVSIAPEYSNAQQSSHSVRCPSKPANAAPTRTATLMSFL